MQTLELSITMSTSHHPFPCAQFPVVNPGSAGSIGPSTKTSPEIFWISRGMSCSRKSPRSWFFWSSTRTLCTKKMFWIRSSSKGSWLTTRRPSCVTTSFQVNLGLWSTDLKKKLRAAHLLFVAWHFLSLIWGHYHNLLEGYSLNLGFKNQSYQDPTYSLVFSAPGEHDLMSGIINLPQVRQAAF